MDNSLTGNPFVDKHILQQLDDQTILNTCEVDKYAYSICLDDDFWRRRIENTIPELLGFKIPEMSYYDLYFRGNIYTLDRDGATLAKQYGDQLMLKAFRSQNIKPKSNTTLLLVQCTQDLINFFNSVNLGPLIDGQLEANPQGWRAPNMKAIPNSRLQDELFFLHPTINGLENPLYGIINDAILFKLFELYFKYNLAPIILGASRYSSSDEMRQYLGEMMELAIDNQITNYLTSNPSLQEKIIEKRDLAKRAINDPQLIFNMSLKPGEKSKIFNPNNFEPMEIMKLIKYGTRPLIESAVDDLRWDTYQVYRHLPQFSGRQSSIESVINDQKETVILANKFISR